MNELISIFKASEILGVSVSTLRRWELEGKLIPQRTLGGHRRYSKEAIEKLYKQSNKEVI